MGSILFLACSISLLTSLFILRDHRSNAIDSSRSVIKGCDLFNGTWVYDKTFPLYSTLACPFIEHAFDCVDNKRPDKLFLNYKWKPYGCQLPRLDGRELLEKFKGKKVLFVGDSLSLNQWQSLTCMLHAAAPRSNYTINRTGYVSTFKIPDYKLSIVISRNAFLVDTLAIQNTGRVLKLDSIENGKDWKGYDMLIFNTWHWWLHTGRKQPWEYMEEGGRLLKDMDRLVAFEKGLTTWSNWVDSNINLTKTQVFFQGISPDHDNGEDWKAGHTNTCQGETKPVTGNAYLGGSLPALNIVKKVLKKMTKKVVLLDVTYLSQLRKDGHPSIYGFGGKRGNDCSHWCLPGVPDTWNQLLYTLLAKV